MGYGRGKNHRSKKNRRELELRRFETLEQRVALHGGAVDEFDVLVFSKTEGFRHGSIQTGIETIEQIGFANGFHVVATEDASTFSDDGLAEYEAVVFLNTTGNVLNDAQQNAFEGYINSGGGYVGVHSAADTEYGWSWYGELVGAYFRTHPAQQPGTIHFEDRVHPATAGLPERWTVNEEWYDYRTNPRGQVHVLATLDESTYDGGIMGYDHPIAWSHEYDGGRAFYTGLGHSRDIYATAEMQEHLLGGILYAAGQAEAEPATVRNNYRQVILDDATDNPMELDIASDGRVFFAERGGRVRMYDPTTDSTRTVGSVSVTQGGEDGLLGIALDPNFDSNGHIFLIYSTPTADENRLSRFTVIDNRFDIASEKILLTVPSQHQCCHSGGSVEFGPDGTLYLSTGDATNPFQSDGYAPIDERPGRQIFDAQRTSANTDDLRGKVLRIRPEADGTYSIPEGNLFPADGSEGRPEIYVMGSRNPFRISIDSETGWLYWGDVGADAKTDNDERGPAGHDEVNQAREAGNFGWPYFVGDNKAYNDFDFTTSVTSDLFDPAATVNDSPNNTGATVLPPAQPALIWYPNEVNDEFPELGRGGRTAMAGPVYHYDASLDSDIKLPEYFDDTLFIYEWSRHWIQEVKLDDNGDILGVNPIFTRFRLRRPIDMTIGPDGALYVLEWGTEFGGGNTDSQLSRIEFVRGAVRQQVNAIIEADTNNGPAPLTVSFTAATSASASLGEFTYSWDFDNDGVIDSTDVNPSFTYVTPGTTLARLTVGDEEGPIDSTTLEIVAGNSRPELEIVSPVEGQFFDWGDEIAFEVKVTDAEDGSSENGAILATQLDVQPLLGHDSHGHPLDIYNEFDGSFTSPVNGHGGANANVYLAVEARFEDNGAPGVESLSAIDRRILQPRKQQAEHFENASGVFLNDGETAVLGFDDGDYFSFTPVHLGDITDVEYRTIGVKPGIEIELRLDAPDGELLTTHSIDVTAGEVTSWSRPIPSRASTHELFFVLLGAEESLEELEIDWIEFQSNQSTVTLPGDANGNGLVDFLDFIALANNFGTPSGATQSQGDFDSDGDVDFRDLIVLANNFGRSL